MHYCFRAGMYKQGLLHDLSKYAPVEFLVGCKYYQGDRSPNNAEREDTGISKYFSCRPANITAIMIRN